jgi:hypothetical protein
MLVHGDSAARSRPPCTTKIKKAALTGRLFLFVL